MKRDSPLPNGWEVGYDHDGKPFYIDHNEEKTTWVDPRDRNTRPKNAADCSEAELPYGWEESYDSQIGVYYIDHISKKNQLEDPRIKWKEKQESMIHNYVQCAHEDLNTKNQLLHAKSERLQIAQEEVVSLQSLLLSQGMKWRASEMSLVSAPSLQSGTRVHQDHERLRDELDQARSRVSQLQSEMNALQAIVASKERGLARLDNLAASFACQEPLSVEGAKTMMARINNLHSSLARGEKERNWLISELSHLCGDNSKSGHLSGVGEQISGNDLNISNAMLRLNVPNGPLGGGGGSEGLVDGSRLAQLARLRLEMNETRQAVENFQLQLAQVEASIVPALEDADESKVLLLVEKKKLLHDLQTRLRQQQEKRDRSSRHEFDPERQPRVCSLEEEVRQLLEEVQAKEKSMNQRVQRQRTKWILRQRLEQAVQRLTQLESAIKDMSASTTTLASSAGSSSLSSLASSIGSLNSVSMVDIYRSTTNAPVTSLNGVNFGPNPGAIGNGGGCLADSLASASSVSQLNTILEAMSVAGSEAGNHNDTACPSYVPGPPYWESPQQRRALNRHYVNLDSNIGDNSAKTVSDAVSKESVTGDSGVFEGRMERYENGGGLPLQVYLRLEYNPAAEELLVCLERCQPPPSPDSELSFRVGLESSPHSSVSTRWFPLSPSTPFLELSEVMHVPLTASELRYSRVQVSALLRPPERSLGACQVSVAELDSGPGVCAAWHALRSDTNRSKIVVPHGSLASRVMPYVVAKPTGEVSDEEARIPGPEEEEKDRRGGLMAAEQQIPSKFYSPVYRLESQAGGIPRSRTYNDASMLQNPLHSSNQEGSDLMRGVNILASRAVRLNRSESDSMVPLRRQATSPFTRLAQDRRSVRLPTSRGGSRHALNRSIADRNRPWHMPSYGFATPLRSAHKPIVDRARSVTSLDLLLDLEASELRHTEQRQELQSLRQLHGIIREHGCDPDQIRCWMEEHESLAKRISRRRGSRVPTVERPSVVQEETPDDGEPHYGPAPPHANCVLQERRMRRVLKAVERRVRDLQRGSSFEIPLSHKLAFFVARAAEELEEEGEEEDVNEVPSAPSAAPVRGMCLPLVVTDSEPTEV